MVGFFSKGSQSNKKEEKIIQLIRSWYYNNGKSIDEIIMELKEGWGLGEEQVKELLIRAGLISPSNYFANLPETRKLTASQVLTLKDTISKSSSFTGEMTNTANIKQMIDNAIKDLEGRIDKRLKILDKNISDTVSALSEYKKTLDQVKQEVERLKQIVDEKSIISMLNKIRSEINNLIDKLENLRLMVNENKNELEKIEASIALLKLSASAPSERISNKSTSSELKSSTLEKEKMEKMEGNNIKKYKFEDIFKPKQSSETLASQPENETPKIEREIQEILKILEE